MKSLKIKALIVILLASLLVCTGCWDYSEINKKAIVSGAAIDYDAERNEYIVTVEFISPKGGGGEGAQFEPINYTGTGHTVFDAIRNLINKVGKRLYWAHAKIIIISDEIAKKGVVPVIDFINRDAEVRPDVSLIVSREESARKLLRGYDEGHDTLAFHLSDMIQNQSNVSKFPVIETWKFVNYLAQEGESPILPTAHQVRETNQVVPDLYGTAIFKKDKMVGWINGQETQSLLHIRDELKGGLVHTIHMAGMHTNVTLELFRAKTKLKPIIKDGKLIMTINAKLEVDIAEIDTVRDVIQKKERELLKKETEEMMNKGMINIIKKVQKEYKADIFHFAGTIQREMPDEWKKIKDNWEEVFSELPVEITSEVDIKGSALTSKPIKVSD